MSAQKGFSPILIVILITAALVGGEILIWISVQDNFDNLTPHA